MKGDLIVNDGVGAQAPPSRSPADRGKLNLVDGPEEAYRDVHSLIMDNPNLPFPNCPQHQHVFVRPEVSKDMPAQ